MAAAGAKRRQNYAVRAQYRTSRRGIPQDLIVAVAMASTNKDNNLNMSGAETDGATYARFSSKIGIHACRIELFSFCVGKFLR